MKEAQLDPWHNWIPGTIRSLDSLAQLDPCSIGSLDSLAQLDPCSIRSLDSLAQLDPYTVRSLDPLAQLDPYTFRSLLTWNPGASGTIGSLETVLKVWKSEGASINNEGIIL